LSRVDIGLIIAGQAGQGVQVISRTLGRLLVRGGYYAFASQDVMSRIRGGHNFARVRISDTPVRADADKAQILIVLHPELVEKHVSELAENAVVLVDAKAESLPDGLNVLRLPLEDLAKEIGKDPITLNSVAVGAALALVGFAPDGLEGLLESQFAHKGAEVVARNQAAAQAGFKAVLEEQKRSCPHRLERRDGGDGRVLISGCEALALGAIAAGVRVVAGYPMSPGTPVLEYCSRHAGETGLIVEQTEDEVAAMNLALGASFAGAPSMVCTAGGGFALMTEGLSLAGMTETPVLVCVGMRPGPATGLATRTAQADLLYAIYAGHGEFPRVVLTPADAARAFRAAADGLRLAEKYQTPVIVLYDQFMGDALWTVATEELKYEVPSGNDKVQVGQGLSEYVYRRYENSADGVSPRLLPGTAGQVVYADSDEHSEEGHITESAAMRVQMVDKRNRKLQGLAAELQAQGRSPAAESSAGNRKALVFCFGSTKGVAAEAVERLRTEHEGLAMVHLDHVWPFPGEAVRALAKGCDRMVTVESNYTGQLAQLLAQECGLKVHGSVRRYDGRQFSVAEVEAGIKEQLGE
jgi:2-oxoglutarate ferredoxin oxidoreductase subunit alpha